MNSWPTSGASGFWYGRERTRSPAVRVLEALRDYRAAETAMRRRTKDSMGMGESDLLALRYLLEASRAGRPMGPRDLASRLGISSASTTTLLDRLASRGHIRRQPHPSDRRALIITVTDSADAEVRVTLGAMHRRMLEAAEELSPEEADTVVRFLDAARGAMDGVPESGDGPEPS